MSDAYQSLEESVSYLLKRPRRCERARQETSDTTEWARVCQAERRLVRLADYWGVQAVVAGKTLTDTHHLAADYLMERLEDNLGLAGEGWVVVRDVRSHALQTSVLAHELAHNFFNHGEKANRGTFAGEELQAELASYILMHHLGVNMERRTRAYLAQYWKSPTKAVLWEMKHNHTHYMQLLRELDRSSSRKKRKRSLKWLVKEELFGVFQPLQGATAVVL